MKKTYHFLMLLTLSLLLYACENSENEITIDVLVPNGTTAVSHALIEHGHDSIAVERVSGTNLLISAFTSESHDIIIAPINLGANLYNKGADYQLLGVLTWSNLQFISNEPIESVHDLIGKDIHAFGKGAIPEMIVDSLLTETDLIDDVNINYHSQSAQESYTHFMQNGGIALTAQPVTTIANNNVEDLYILNVEDLWHQFMGNEGFPQAGIFVKSTLTNDQIELYSNALTEGINQTYTKPNLIANYCESMDYPFPKAIIEQTIPYSGIDYVHIDQAKQVVLTFMDQILEFNPDLINDKLPEDHFYYSTNE
ncbi:MAG: hypothetical protein ACOC1L_08340 [Bacillota bacterium]